MIIDSGLELVTLLLAVDNLGKLISIFLEQVSNQTIVEFFLDTLERRAFFISSECVIRLV